MDAQYTREQYNVNTAGFGHGTPDYCLRVATETQVKQLIMTHFDPFRDDGAVKKMLAEAVELHKTKYGESFPINFAFDGTAVIL
jgi:ribonuclease BN (tRNA processing enzyme)